VCREYAMQNFEEAQENEIYVCGMQTFDALDTMHGVIITRNGLECHQPMEFDYYQAKVVAAWFNDHLCAYCAGSPRTEGYIDERSTQEWRSVLPVCPSCRAGGALPIARTKRRNGDAIQRSGRRAHLVPDDEVEEVVMKGGASGVIVPQDVLRPTRARNIGRVRRRR
jgi:hypothetical protein